jgi:adenine-specific DNA-methyltransferase
LEPRAGPDFAAGDPVIKYIGSKRTLVPLLLEIVRHAGEARCLLDLFSGTSRVGHAFKAAGYRVLANDHNAYAAVLARCYVQADVDDVLGDARRLVREFNALPGKPGYFTETFCRRSRFFQPHNGARIDAIREAIAAKSLDPELEAVLLVSLMEAADRVDSTTGLQMAYLKTWSPRSYKDLELRLPAVLPRALHGKGVGLNLDALEAAARFEADVVYVDPPYNQHSYLANYHVWETLVRWDRPEVYGVACKRSDVRVRHSAFNSRPTAREALRQLLARVRAPLILLSFNDEGFLGRDALEFELGALWQGEARVAVLEIDFPRYVGARIGIHNPHGEKVGTIGRVRNKEFVYIVSRDNLSEALARAAEAHPWPFPLRRVRSGA